MKPRVILVLVALVATACMVEYPDTSAILRKPLMKRTSTPAPELVATARPLPTQETAVIVGTWNVRLSSNSGSIGVGYVYSGDEVRILDCDGNWMLIEYGGNRIGWVHKNSTRSHLWLALPMDI